MSDTSIYASKLRLDKAVILLVSARLTLICKSIYVLSSSPRTTITKIIIYHISTLPSHEPSRGCFVPSVLVLLPKSCRASDCLILPYKYRPRSHIDAPCA